MCSSRGLVCYNLVWTYNEVQGGLETICFGGELGDLWNVNATLLDENSRSQNHNSIPVLHTNICIKTMLAVAISELF